MKRFLLFGDVEYDGEHGLNSFLSDFDTLRDAVDAAKKWRELKKIEDTWFQVFDTKLHMVYDFPREYVFDASPFPEGRKPKAALPSPLNS